MDEPRSNRTMLQALLHEDNDDAAGFGFESPWPGSTTILAPLKIGMSTAIAGGDLGSGRIASGDLGSGRIKD